jgi:hypothetical protein
MDIVDVNHDGCPCISSAASSVFRGVRTSQIRKELYALQHTYKCIIEHATEHHVI